MAAGIAVSQSRTTSEIVACSSIGLIGLWSYLQRTPRVLTCSLSCLLCSSIIQSDPASFALCHYFLYGSFCSTFVSSDWEILRYHQYKLQFACFRNCLWAPPLSSLRSKVRSVSVKHLSVYSASSRRQAETPHGLSLKSKVLVVPKSM